MIKLSDISCCLNTKEAAYPKEIIDMLSRYDFGEILIRTHSDSPYGKYDMFRAASKEYIYYQDDDALCSVAELAELAQPGIINVVLKQTHFDAHVDNRSTMGLGWGAIFPKSMLESLTRYTEKYGIDAVYKRETERIFTYLNFPQNRLVLPVLDLPSAHAEDRLWRQPQHQPYKKMAEMSCATLV